MENIFLLKTIILFRINTGFDTMTVFYIDNGFRVQDQQAKDLWQKILKTHHKHGWMNRKSLDINFRW